MKGLQFFGNRVEDAANAFIDVLKDVYKRQPVTFRLTGHGYTSNSAAFRKFREAVEAFFKRFIPYHVSFDIQYLELANGDFGYPITEKEVQKVNRMLELMENVRRERAWCNRSQGCQSD